MVLGASPIAEIIILRFNIIKYAHHIVQSLYSLQNKIIKNSGHPPTTPPLSYRPQKTLDRLLRLLRTASQYIGSCTYSEAGENILNGPREQRLAVKFASTHAAADRYVNGYTARHEPPPPPPPPNEREPRPKIPTERVYVLYQFQYTAELFLYTKRFSPA